jgi:hypothetical protein
MNENLNNLETALLKTIISENKKDYPFIDEHIAFLYVRNRENTGVGIYTNFGYNKDFKTNNINTIISSNKTLRINGLKDEVTYVLDISEGKINFLEIVTNGDDVFINDVFDYDFELF